MDEKDWVKTFELIDEYLAAKLGEHNIPLRYIVRETVAVQSHFDDPSTNYSTAALEMIARAPHDDPAYTINNGKTSGAGMPPRTWSSMTTSR